MPVYQYLEGERLVERVLPVARRDDFPGRLAVPRRVLVCPRGRISQGEQVLRGFYEVEQRDPSMHRQLKANLGLSAAQIREAWSRRSGPMP
jgi:hypothetical protein